MCLIKNTVNERFRYSQMKGTDEGTAEVASSQRVNKGDPSVDGEGVVWGTVDQAVLHYYEGRPTQRII